MIKVENGIIQVSIDDVTELIKDYLSLCEVIALRLTDLPDELKTTNMYAMIEKLRLQCKDIVDESINNAASFWGVDKSKIDDMNNVIIFPTIPKSWKT